MKVLLVEDEQHKATDLERRLLGNGIAPENLIRAAAVREAVLQVTEQDFDLIVLDMALPTFSGSGVDKSGGGAAQAVGGLEVLRTLKHSGRKPKIIVITQYPEIILGGNRVRLSQISRVASQKYDQSVLGAVLYSYQTPEWEAAFDTLVRRAK